MTFEHILVDKFQVNCKVLVELQDLITTFL